MSNSKDPKCVPTKMFLLIKDDNVFRNYVVFKNLPAVKLVQFIRSAVSRIPKTKPNNFSSHNKDIQVNL